MNKTIWIINQHTATPLTTNGHYRHYFLSKYFNNLGYNIVLIQGSFSHLSKLKQPTKKIFTKFKFDGIINVVVKVPRYDSGNNLMRFFNLLLFSTLLFFLPKKNLPKPDIILISSMPLFPIINGIFFKKIYKGSKLILELRDLWPISAIELGGYSKHNIFIRFMSLIEKIGYNQADYITSVLPNAYKHIANVTEREFNFKHIPNGINIFDFQNKQVVSNSFDSIIPTDKFIIGYTGSLGVANYMHVLIDAAEILKGRNDICFIIVGNGYLRNNLINKAECLKNVIFIDSVPKSKIPSVISKFDVCYISWKDSPLYQYGVSANKIFDYMYCGKPIIMSGQIPDNEISKACCGHLIQAENSDLLAKKIIEFINLPSVERVKMGNNGKEYVIKNHTYRNLASKYLEVFEELN